MMHPPCSRHPGPLSRNFFDSDNLTLLYRLLVDCGLYHSCSLSSSKCDSELVKEMREDDSYFAQNIFYLPKPTADVSMVKIVLSACFVVDIDADNLRLRIRLPTQLIAKNRKTKYTYIDLNNNNQKLVERPDCVDQKVNIFTLKIRNSSVWGAYLPKEADDYDDARMMLEDEWLDFVT
jgi:hypothetical protein